jgi:hypothetical protein
MRTHESSSPTATATGAGPFADPVFVLCNGRSGSTLLRFVLDAHPELACPPETNLPVLCAQLATVWSLIEGAPLSENRGDEPPEIPEAAIAGVRETMDRMVGSYLARRGKKRYCDKSLGTARYAPLLQRVYPDARFICVYRHPMDVIASGAEACPWGLSGYGFDPYIAATPGNAVMALANFWADNVQVTLAAEERFAAQCFRLRYEDLVIDPEATAAALFDFLGVAAAPGISAACFSAERERFGPADYKIWYTSQISPDSVGRGWSVPAGMIAPQLLAVMNGLAGKLGYLAIDGDWGTTEPPADLRVPITEPSAEADADGAHADGAHADGAHADGTGVGGVGMQGAHVDGTGADGDAGPAGSAAPGAATDIGAQVDEELRPEEAMRAKSGKESRAAHVTPGGPLQSDRLGAALRAGLMTARDGDAADLPGSYGGETFVAVVITKGAERRAEYWLVDLGQATVTPVSSEAQEDSDWDIIGTWGAWEQVIDRQVNLSVALRSCQLRYCDNGEATALAADTRIGIMGRLLGLASWK